MIYAATALVLLLAVHADTNAVFLERWLSGHVPGLSLSEQGLTQRDIFAVYWYRDALKRQVLVSFFEDLVRPQNVSQGVFDMDSGDFSLVIANVSDSNEGSYWYTVKPKNRQALSGNVTVKVKVTPERTTPVISECRPSGRPSATGECEVALAYGTESQLLTCDIRNAKPAADIRWFRLLDGQATRIQHDPPTVLHTVLREKLPGIDWTRVNNTYNTSSSIYVHRYNGDVQRYRCDAYGVALGDDLQSGSHETATVRFLPRQPGDPATSAPEAEAMQPPAYALLLAVGLPVVSLTILVIYIKREDLRSFMRRRQQQNLPHGRGELVALRDVPTLESLQGVLRDLFTTRMHNISTGLLSDDGDTRHTDDIFIDLELIQQDHRRQALTSREQMVGLVGDRNRNHFVLQGKAGCGKSTLVRRLAYDWSVRAHYLARFELVFLLKLKDVMAGHGFLDAVLEQNFPGDCTAADRDHLRQILADVHSRDQRLLAIFDGLDEIGSAVLKSKAASDDFSIRDVLAGSSLPWCRVLVTTRPHTVADLLSYSADDIYTRIETTGFTDANRNKYIRCRFENDVPGGERLIREIETRAFLKTLAKIPIMLKLLCILSREGESIPTRITRLYDKTVNLLVRYWARREGISSREAERRWTRRRQKELGKVAYRGLMMHPDGERLTFSRQDFSEETLKLGFELGLFSEETRTERSVTFSHKSFQEYYAAYYLVGQCGWFIRRQLRSKVNIDTVEKVEYLLRFSCGMSPTAACIIFDHVRGIRDDLISDRYLRVQHLTLMLYYEAQSRRLGAGVGSRLALTYEEEFEALHYYVGQLASPDGREPTPAAGRAGALAESASLPKISLDRLEIYLHVIRDQTKVVDILKFVEVNELYFGLLVADEFVDDLDRLAVTLSELPHKPARTIVCVNQREEPGDHQAQPAGNRDAMEAVVDFCQRIRTFVFGFGLRVECPILDAGRAGSLEELASALGAMEAAYFGVLGNDLSGRVASLAPIGPRVQYIELYDCNLSDADLRSLALLLGGGQPTRLRELYISGATFTEVDPLLRALLDCPRLLMLELHEVGLEQRAIRQSVGHFFPKMELVDGNVEGQFWLWGREPRRRDDVTIDVDVTTPLMEPMPQRAIAD